MQANNTLQIYNQELYALTAKTYGSISYEQVIDDSGLVIENLTISRLASLLNQLYEQGKRLIAAKIFVHNKDLLKHHVNNSYTLKILELFLKYDEITLANDLYKAIKNTGDGSSVSKMHYILALYHFEQGRWQEAQTHLTSIEYQDALTTEESDYSTLIFGITLQHAKNHREAIKYYEKITEDSIYFTHALLNKATAFIRQGWWTDAQIAIDQSINKTNITNSNNLANRLYLILGYSQLRHEFYRDARKSFRQLSLDSQYKNRALLGIGLSALNQGDYIGAINAFDRLKSFKTEDISVTEAYLLSAYTHEQIKQTATAAAQYAEAISYYQYRINTVSSDEERSITTLALDNNDSIGLIKRKLEISKYLSNTTNDAVLQSKISNLESKYRALLDSEYKKKSTKELEILTSYLSQAQFGQAKIYDHAQ